MKKVIIVGGGTGGLSVARELSKNPNVTITIIEKGPLSEVKDAYKYYDVWDKNEMELIKTDLVGGSSLVIAGNFVPTLVEELKEYDIDITPQLEQLKTEIGIQTMPKSHEGKINKLLKDAAAELGLDMQDMPKGINPNKCTQCGKCAWGCPNGAKWSSIEDLKIAQENGVNLITNEGVTGLIIEENKIKGVKTNKGNTFMADVVVLAAGGMITPKLLRTAGIKAGETFSVDPFITVGGYLKGANQDHEIQMNKFIKLPHIVIASHTSQFLLPKIQETHPDATSDDIISFMIKVPDNLRGHVYMNEVVKGIDFEDASLLARGAAIAGNILVKAGADIESLSSTHVRGAHLIASARIGEIVDSNLETEIENLYVGDGSVLPEAPGLPPIYTILALSRRLGQYLANKL
ncbi:GMC family oxidoreductase N-terminal domain-containing protein [Methanosphaera sp. ISO3-F5]|uniref:GMC family oxidoreductase N-terminal domain-containing protein n=1 Tax=Methanosphaera sp. ISO3-F5 TaxID=1452353 RepID=UPI002B2582ED|nr:GMC family oxidoreductase N-terminal domain-containing protein [Methanosphaera sp. ISO3-F5]WQH65078.1 GMC family oxidoreductase N-terminal domain-containing protein [Methanosphaera sp. ISO3-F5]